MMSYDIFILVGDVFSFEYSLKRLKQKFISWLFCIYYGIVGPGDYKGAVPLPSFTAGSSYVHPISPDFKPSFSPLIICPNLIQWPVPKPYLLRHTYMIWYYVV